MSTSYGSFGTGTVSDFGGGKTYEFAKKKYGNIGKKISVYSNYFSIDVNCRIVYHYNIDIQVHDYVKDSGDSNVPQRSKLSQQKKMFKNVNFLVFDTLCKEHNTIFSSEPVFDGAKNIYSKTKLRLDNDKTTKLTIEQRVQERKFKVKFDVIITTPKDSHELDLSILNEPNVRNAEKEIQALDIIMQYGPKRHKISVGSNFFLTKADLQELPLGVRKSIRFDLGEMKEVSYGHYQSAKLTEKGIQLNVDRVAIVFNKGGKLINLIEQLCTELRSGPQRRDSAPPRQIEINQSFKFNQNELKLLNEELKGLDFEVDHISYKPKNKIFAITDKTVCEIKFTEKLKDGTTRETSVKEYFEKIYVDYLDRLGRDLYPNLPCVQVGKINPKFFPLEVVSIIEDQYSTRKLKPKHQATMTRTCGQQQPTQRFEESKIQAEKLIGTPRAGQTDYLKNFDIKVRTNYAECNGRVLDPASILYKDNRNVRPRDGQWRADGKFVIPSENVGSNWMVINFTRDYNNQIRFAPQRNQIDDFIRTVIQCSRDSGLNLQNPCNVVYNEAYRGRQDLEDAMADYLQDHKDCRLIIYVVPKLDELYSNIKYLSEIVFGVVTQCVSQDKSKQFVQMQYVSNLMLKINSKLGGSNVHLAPESKVAYLKKKTMIMGLDTTHPSERDRLANSVSSVVATYDKYMVNYFSRCVVQPKPRSEIIQLDEITKEMLDNFKKVNGFHPDFLLIYRDGISEGQFKEVVDKEINLIKKAFSQISPSYNPKITFIVVQKRHHTRFLAANPRDRIPKSQNVLPGTCIDNTITSNYYFDFFLCAHFGALGTSRPTRYFVLHDDTDFSGDEIQQTTNVLSYLFPRCLKAVSIPPAVLYAHLACKRARSYLFTLDNNRGIVFGEKELTATEIKELNQKIEVKSNLRNILYYV